MLVELHCHSHYSRQARVKSEGMNSPEEIMHHAKKLGVGAVAISDHNVFRAGKEAEAAGKRHGVVCIPAEEVDTQTGHVLAVGISEWIKPWQGARETIDKIHSQGAVAIASHPFDIYNKGIRRDARFCDAMEAFNCLNLDRIANIRAGMFSKKHRVPAVAGSDAHMLEMMGHGLTYVEALDAEGIIRQIKKGRVSVATRNYIPVNLVRHWSITRLQNSYDSVMDYIEKNYTGPKRLLSRKMLKLVRGYPGSAESLFKLISYVSIGSAVAYSAVKTGARL